MRENIEQRLNEYSVGRRGHPPQLADQRGASQEILGLGTSFGYSTVWLAEAARLTRGQVTSLELREEKVDFARGKL